MWLTDRSRLRIKIDALIVGSDIEGLAKAISNGREVSSARAAGKIAEATLSGAQERTELE